MLLDVTEAKPTTGSGLSQIPPPLIESVLSDMALTAQCAARRGKNKIVFFAAIEVMTAPTAHASVEKPYAGIYAKGHIKVAAIARCLYGIGHADRMVGHI